ncbi:MAG: bifunctional oligoribonuclease/PAP phosphatase NrnA [Quinella sp. 1Q5]|nr:bifunctional oligoribonuclease/PAP phosphatase NrnA [Quinella sp. 1Q5]
MLITLKEAATRLQAANRILITAHIHPDGDAIGSTLAAMQILRAMGKTAVIFIDDKVPQNLHSLPCFDEVSRPADGETFDADLLLILDTSLERIGNVRKMTNAPILNIDHHVTNIGDGYALYVEDKAAATCEIIFKLARELGETITPDIATCLYSGIARDTGFFKFSNTSAETLAIASELVTYGASPYLISEQMNKKSLAEVIGLRDALNSLKTFYGDKVAGMTLDYATVSKFDSTEGIIDEIRGIDTVDVVFLISEREPNVCRVSIRSKGVDVAKIAARLGGGGHIRAAGCTLKTTLAEAEKILVEAIGKAL